MLGAGDCFLLTTNKNADGYELKHLFVILFDGENHTGNTLIVPICTYDSDKQDKTTLLQPGDHEFLSKVSYVSYRLTRTASIKDIQGAIDEGTAKQKPRINAEILERICSGVLKSHHTPNEIKHIHSNYVFRKLKK